MMTLSTSLVVGATLPELEHTATPVQLFRYSAITWNGHRIHFDHPYALEEGHDGVVVHSHLRAALALRCVTEGLGPDWAVTSASYRLRKPAFAPVTLKYGARVSAIDNTTMTLDLIEEHPDAGVGFEGRVSVHRQQEGSSWT